MPSEEVRHINNKPEVDPQQGITKKGNGTEESPHKESKSTPPTSEPVKKDKAKRKGGKSKKVKSKRRKYVSSSDDSSSDGEVSSSDSDSSDSSDEWVSESEDEDAEYFDPIEAQQDNKLPKNLDKFAKKYFIEYLKPDHMKKVREGCEIPDSKAFVVPKLENDWREAMGDDKASKAIMGNDRNMVNIQNTLMGAMGPISEIWVTLDMFMKKGRAAQVDLPFLISFIEKAIICLGQTNVHLNYYRRLPIVTKLMGNPRKAQSLLKKNSKKLKGRKLLGTKFQKIVRKSLKKKREAKELKKSLFNENKPFQGRPSVGTSAGGRSEYRSQVSGL